MSAQDIDPTDALAIVEKIRTYAEERYRYGLSDRTVGSMRIASDLYTILGVPITERPDPGPRGELSAGQIEDAAKAIAAYQGFRYPGSLKDTWDGMARVALLAAVGGNMSAPGVPTHEEREALIAAIEASPAFQEYSAGRLADAILAAGFHCDGECSDAQVEAAAKALYQRHSYRDDDAWEEPWDATHTKLQADYRDDALAALNAARGVA